MYQDPVTGLLGQVTDKGVIVNATAFGGGKLIEWHNLEFALRALRAATQEDGSIPDLPGFSGFSKYAKEQLGSTANMVQVIKHDMHYRTKNGKEVTL